MEYKKLLTDYLNKNSEILDEKVVVKTFQDMGNFITVYIEWEDLIAIHSTYIDIPLFDLLTFVYSKI